MRKAINVLSIITMVFSSLYILLGVGCFLLSKNAETVAQYVKELIFFGEEVEPLSEEGLLIIKISLIITGVCFILGTISNFVMGLIDYVVFNRDDRPKAIAPYIVLAILTFYLSFFPLAVLVLLYGVTKQYNKEKEVVEE